MTDGHNNENGEEARPKEAHAEPAELKERISSLNDRKEQAFQNKQELSTKIGEKIRLVNEHKKARNDLTKQVRDLKEERDKLNTQISASIAQLKELQPEKREEPLPIPQLPYGPRGENIHPSELKRKIKAIEQKIETVPMSFDAEQKLMKQLKQMKKHVGNMETSAGKHSELITKSKEIDKLKKSANALHAKVTQLAKQSQEYHEKIITLSKEIEDLKAQEEKLQEDFLGAKKEYLEATGSMRESQAEQQAARNVMRDQREREKQQRLAEDKKTLQQRAKEAESKMVKGSKLTTEDLLALQSIKD